MQDSIFFFISSRIYFMRQFQDSVDIFWNSKFWKLLKLQNLYCRWKIYITLLEIPTLMAFLKNKTFKFIFKSSITALKNITFLLFWGRAGGTYVYFFCFKARRKLTCFFFFFKQYLHTLSNEFTIKHVDIHHNQIFLIKNILIWMYFYHYESSTINI